MVTLPTPETRSPSATEASLPATLSAASAGDPQAFEELVRLYSRQLFSIAYAIVQDTAEAEDIVQDTFVKAHREVQRFREPEKFPAWLMMVTRNAARDGLRRRKPQAPPESFAVLEDSGVPRPGSALSASESQAGLRRALSSLPEEHRLALTLRYLEGLDYRAIEERMSISNGALRGILGRALGTLRRMPALEEIRP